MVLGFDNPFAPSTGSFPLPVVPPDSDPDEGDQVTVCFAAAWLPYVLGALQQLTLQATWAGDYATILLAQSRAQLLLASFGDVSGGCFDTVCFTDVFYDHDCDCVKQTPFGGGDPIDKPQADPRHNPAFEFPPIIADDPQCQAAANMVRFLHDLIDEIISVLDHTSEAAGVVGFLLPIFVELGPFALFIDLMLELASIFTGAGASALTDAFTSDVYDHLTCIFFCDIETDGTVTADDLVTIETKIGSEIGGLVQTVLEAMFLITGEVGLSNEGAVGTAPADCSGCGCEWCYQFDFTLSDGGWNSFSTPGAVYSPGVGWTDATSGGTRGTYIESDTFALTTFTHIEFDYQAVDNVTSTVDYGRVSGTIVMIDVCPGALGSFTVGWDGSVDFDQVGLQVGNSTDFPAGSSKITRALFRGTGTNPFGSDNC